MILVDTSIWVEHARRSNSVLERLLMHQLAFSHPFVLGELALGGMKPSTLELIRRLPRAVVARDEEVYGLIQRRALAGRGIGYVDAHLLASARLTGDLRLWTLDKKMVAVAEDLDLSATFGSSAASHSRS